MAKERANVGEEIKMEESQIHMEESKGTEDKSVDSELQVVEDQDVNAVSEAVKNIGLDSLLSEIIEDSGSKQVAEESKEEVLPCAESKEGEISESALSAEIIAQFKEAVTMNNAEKIASIFEYYTGNETATNALRDLHQDAIHDAQSNTDNIEKMAKSICISQIHEEISEVIVEPSGNITDQAESELL